MRLEIAARVRAAIIAGVAAGVVATPWFVAMRGAVTFMAHLVFGISLAVACHTPAMRATAAVGRFAAEPRAQSMR